MHSFTGKKRHQSCDLTGKTAVVTGARLKIGFHVALKLLRAGCYVIATTRFPVDALKRFKAESDFSDFANRLELHCLDFRNLRSVELFIESIAQRHSSLDILVNNAAQTIQRPSAYYKSLIETEKRSHEMLLEAPLAKVAYHGQLMFQRSALHEVSDARLDAVPHPPCDTGSASPLGRQCPPLSAVAGPGGPPQLQELTLDSPALGEQNREVEFPEGAHDVYGQQLDLRKKNLWVLKLGEVSTVELLETLAVNAAAPFILCNGLLKLMDEQRQYASVADVPAKDARFIVNVSAMEGCFAMARKSERHPHTNMAKSSLNMLTRTSGPQLARNGIFMTSVDTGWVSDEMPLERALKKPEFQPPLDEIDAAARILDPIFSPLLASLEAPNSRVEYLYGVFLKNYRVNRW